jgi:hypothetical protein
MNIDRRLLMLSEAELLSVLVATPENIQQSTLNIQV